MALTDPISVPQKEYIRGLVSKRDISSLSQAQQEFLADLSDENLDRMINEQASAAIKVLNACPYKPVTPNLGPPVPVPDTRYIPNAGPGAPPPVNLEPAQGVEEPVRAGYYFIVDPTNNEERFFRVRHGAEGTRWEGYVFLDVQASDYFYPIKDAKHRMAVLYTIAQDPIKAMNEYGLKLGRCGVCNRTLTDRHSILRGIGPICAAKLGPTQEQEDLLRKLGLIKDTEEEG